MTVIRSKINFHQEEKQTIPITIYEPDTKVNKIISDFPQLKKQIIQQVKMLKNANKNKNIQKFEVAVFFDKDGSLVFAFVF